MMKHKKIIIGTGILLVVIMGLFFCIKDSKNQDKINPEDLPINLETLENLKYHIEIDCNLVKEHLNDTMVWFPNQTIELCKYVYPDLWGEE